jgi:DNA-binding response OmpR family regulator
MSRKRKIMVVSQDPQLAEIRHSILKSAGFDVIAVEDPLSVKRVCEEQKVNLVLIGYCLAPAQKRKVWHEARRVCKVPVLQMHKERGPELMPPAFFHELEKPDDFLVTVINIVTKNLQN